MYLIFDTETNGKIKSWKLPMTFVDNYPRVTQLSFAVFREDASIKIKYNFFITPDGWEIPKEKFFIDNNMSIEKCKEFGIPIKQALNQFLECILDCRYLIAHNIDFDYPVLGAEMIRLGLKSERKLSRICTMKSTMDFCKLSPFKNGEYKFPKLQELHHKLFNEDISNAHDTLGDVLSTAKCFFELKKRNLI